MLASVTGPALFELVAVGRADLFCRSVQEIGQELQAHAGVKGLALDDSLLLSYDLPQYLYTHAGNQVAIERISRGLRLAFADGSLQALMRSYLQPSLARALDQRSAGQQVGHGVPSSPASTTNVASGLNESATGVPGSCAATPASAFWT